jgi:hypothetical protein
MAFAPKITRARYVYSGFSSEQMASLGGTVLTSVVDRIKKGVNCEDSPAKPLKPGRNGKTGYPDAKARRGIAPIRNWISPIQWPKNRIKTLRALKVKTANENRVVIGFIDPKADQIAHINNRQEKMFGLSPKDREVLLETVNEMKRGAVTVKRIA